MDGKRGASLVRKTSPVLTTFPICYAICMRNHRIIIGNVVEGSQTLVHRIIIGNVAEGSQTLVHRIIIGNVAEGSQTLVHRIIIGNVVVGSQTHAGAPHNNRKCG